MSYLGKISALVTVNTGDFAPKLNAAAKSVQGFARSVERDIGSSMQAASRSLGNIYTPLQKFERALQAASTMKLSFSGFPGAIKTLDTLRDRLTSLNKRQIDVILKTSGLGSITAFRDAITGLKSKEFELIARVGGVEKLKKLRESLSVGSGEFSIVADVRAADARLADIKRKIADIKQDGSSIKVAVDTARVSAAAAELSRAKTALSVFADANSGGRGISPSALRGELGDKIVGIDEQIAAAQQAQINREAAMRQPGLTRKRADRINSMYPDQSEAIAGLESQKKEAEAILAQLSVLGTQVTNAKRNLASSQRGTVTGGPSELRELKREAREAEVALSRLVSQAQQKLSASLGIDLSAADVEKFIRNDVNAIDSLIEKASQMEAAFKKAGLSSASAAESVRRVMTALGDSDLEAAKTRMRQLVSVAETIQKPLAAAKDMLAATGPAVEAAYLPALTRAQAGVENLVAAIERGDTPIEAIERAFAGLLSNVEANVTAIRQLSEATSQLGQLKTGKEFMFSSPEIAERLSRAAELGNAAAGLPAEAISRNPRIARGLVDVRRSAEQVVAARAAVASDIAQGVEPEDERDDAVPGVVQVRPAGSRRILGERQAEFDAAAARLEREVLAEQRQQFEGRARAEFANNQLRVLNADDAGLALREGERTSLPANYFRDQLERERRQFEGRARAEFANNQLRVLNADDAGLALREGERTSLPANYFRDQIERGVRAELGPSVDSSPVQVDRLRDDIVTSKNVIASLPAGMRADFAVELAGIEADFGRLRARGIAATADEIENLDARVRQFAASSSRAAASVRFDRRFDATGLQASLDDRQLRGWVAQLEMLETVLVRLSGNGLARGSAAFQRLRQEISAAQRAGTLSNPETIQRLNTIRDQVAGEIAGQRGSGTSSGALRRQLARTGDIGRMGADRFSLALNQAAFAIDDFMSSTGGIEFKLRAISNNITQLAFVLGGTTGLFVGLGAVIGAQVAVALLKFASGGVAAEDRSKALNDALARQKTLVEELANAYKSLGDALLRGTTAAGVDQSQDVTRGLLDARSARSRQQRGEVASLESGVFTEQALQNSLEKRLSDAQTPGEAAAMRSRIEESQRRERAAANRIAAQPAQSPEGLRTAAAQTAGRLLGLRDGIRDRLLTGLTPEGLAAPFTRSGSREFQSFNAESRLLELSSQLPAADREGQVRILGEMIRAIRPLAEQRNFGMSKSGAAVEAEESIALFQQAIKQIEQELSTLRLAQQIDTAFAGLRDSASRVGQAQDQAAEAIRRGVPGARLFQQELNSLSAELTAAYQALATADTEVTEEGARPRTASERQAAVARAQARVDGVRARQSDIDQRMLEAMVGRTVGGERASAAAAGLQNAGLEQTRQAAALRGAIAIETIARARSAEASNKVAGIEQELAKQRERVAAEANPIERLRLQGVQKRLQADLGAARAAMGAATAAEAAAAEMADAAAATAEFILSLDKAASRIKAIGDSVVQLSEQGASSAQQAFVANPFRAGASDAMLAAEQRLVQDRAVVGFARNRLEASLSEASQDPRMQAIARERRQLEAEANQVAADVAAGNRAPESTADSVARANRLTELDREQANLSREFTDARRRELAAILSGVTARERELDRSRQRDAEEPTVTRRRRQIESGLSAAEQIADDAQRRFIANPTDANFARRNEAEAELRVARSQSQILQDRLDSRREAIERDDPAVRDAQDRLRAISEERASIRDNATRQRRELTDDERQQIDGLNAEEASRRESLEGRRAALLKPEQDAVDIFNRQQELRSLATQGRRFGLTEQQRFMEDQMNGGMAAQIMAERDRLQKAVEVAEPGAARWRAQSELNVFMRNSRQSVMEEVAPMLKDFEMERRAARLQGPSRAALQASDITTSQGQAELNRLLRRDDPSKDVNLAELRNQTDRLDRILRAIENGRLPVV